LTYAVALDALPSGIYQTLERNNAWINNVFQPLLLVDPVTREPKPVLATGWDVAPDGQSIAITIRDDVTFHSGRKMTADDVKYTLQQAAKPATASILGFVAASFTDIAIESPTRLKISLPSVQSSLFDFFDQTLIVDQETDAGLANGSQVIGTGPFTFAEWKPGASYTLRKYDKYWAANDVNLDSIEYIVTTDATAELSAMRSGRAQMAWGLTPTDAKGFEGDPRHQVLSAGGNFYWFGVDVMSPPFDKREVRQAIAYALDGERVKLQVLANTGRLSNLYWGPETPGMDASMTNRYSYDPDRAKSMIAAAGASGATLPVAYGANPVVRAMYEIIANNLTAVGLAPSATPMDQPTFQAKQTAGDLGPAFLGLSGQGGLSPATLLNSLPPLRRGNPSHFATPDYEQLRNAVLSAQTPADSTAALQRLSTYLLDEAFSLPVVIAPSQLVATASVHDVSLTSRGPVLFDRAYLSV
jgi:peptide/nickel transport system substrate-binding protein